MPDLLHDARVPLRGLEQVRLFAQLSGQTQLVPVKDSTSWPENTETSYNIVFDSLHRPLLHVAAPVSESGDWDETDSHYFGPDERTILYDVRVSSFGSGCTDLLREERRIFLGRSGRVIAQTRRFTDADDKVIRADSCYRRTDWVAPPKLSASELPFPRAVAAPDSTAPHSP